MAGFWHDLKTFTLENHWRDDFRGLIRTAVFVLSAYLLVYSFYLPFAPNEGLVEQCYSAQERDIIWLKGSIMVTQLLVLMLHASEKECKAIQSFFNNRVPKFITGLLIAVLQSAALVASNLFTFWAISCNIFIVILLVFCFSLMIFEYDKRAYALNLSGTMISGAMAMASAFVAAKFISMVFFGTVFTFTVVYYLSVNHLFNEAHRSPNNNANILSRSSSNQRSPFHNQ